MAILIQSGARVLEEVHEICKIARVNLCSKIKNTDHSSNSGKIQSKEPLACGWC